VLLEAHMIAALQIIVYAGAIMVLFLFVIMLLNLQARIPTRAGAGRAARARVGGGAVLARSSSLARGCAAIGRWRRRAATAAPRPWRKSLFTDFLLPFELTSILLLVAVVGAVVLAQKQRRPTLS
jgi:NADH-quinone oxidoreductase subunit J